MKILDILLTEDFDFEGDVDTAKGFTAPAISVSDLNSLQLRTLKRVDSGLVDIESANEKELDIILDLIDLGLIDEEGNLTDAGRQAIESDTATSSNDNAMNSDKEREDQDIDGDDTSFVDDDEYDDDDQDDIVNYIVK